MRGPRLGAWEGHNVDYWRRVWHAGGAHFFESVTSTNDVAADLAAGGAPDFTVVLAEEQTHGRGRAGAKWQAEPGTSLLFSLLFRIKEAPAPGCAPVRTGLAVASAIAARVGDRALVKWPNDVVITDCGKVAGVLCEATLGQQGTGYVIAGIGINVLQGREQFAEELRSQACSLLIATGDRIDRAELLTELIDELRACANRIALPLTDAERALLAKRDVLRDREIIFERSSESPGRGIARGVAHDGALLVEQNGAIIRIYNATVRLAQARAYPGSSRG